MKKRINIPALFILLLFLTGCGSKENMAESILTAQSENEEPASEETSSQYPLIAASSTAKLIDLAIVSEDMYCIFNGEKYGFLADDGKEIAPCIYDIAYPFSEGLACVCMDGKYGFIDTEGKTVIPFTYDRATPFVEELAYFSIDDKYGFMDKTGTQVFALECDSVSSFQEGIAYFSIDGRYGYIDRKGQIIIEPRFDDAGYFQNGLAKVMENGRCGVINRNGEFIVAAKYDCIELDGSFIIASANGKYSCFDAAGKALLEQVDMIYMPQGKEYTYFRKEEKDGIIDINGNILAEPLYDWISKMPNQNFQIVREDALYGVIDLQGEIKIPAMYDDIDYDSYADAAEGGVFLLTDADGNIISVDAADFSEKIPCSYDVIDWISQDRAVVTQDGLNGIIDREGNVIEPVTYDVIRVFSDGAVWMKKGTETCFYNSSGEAAEGTFDYDDIVELGNCYQTEKDRRYGFLNEQGEEVCIPIYSNISDYNVCGCSANVYVISNYGKKGIGDSVIKTGKPEQADLSDALLHNEITPRAELYYEFVKNGGGAADDSTEYEYGHYRQKDIRNYRITYKLYDLAHSGAPVLYFGAKPYIESSFPNSYSGLYALWDNQVVELLNGYECGGSARGDYVCIWYDTKTAQALFGTEGAAGGFGGFAYWGTICDQKGGEMINIASFRYITQWITNYSEEQIANTELLYDDEGKPYTEETLAQAKEQEKTAQSYYVNDVQTTIEAYREMKDRYQRIYFIK